MLDKEYKFYLRNQKEFAKKYSGKFILIKDQQIQGVFQTKEEAYNQASQKFQLGTFLIQECKLTNEEVVQTFNSRVIF